MSDRDLKDSLPSGGRLVTGCPVCHTPFPTNGELASLPVGGRFAFENASGRVWLICSGCGKWAILGQETARAALPELKLRLRTSELREFENMTLGWVGPRLEIAALKAPPSGEQLLSDPFATLPRDDLAAGGRYQQLTRRAWQSKAFWFLTYSFLTGSLLTSQVIPAVADGVLSPFHILAVFGLLWLARWWTTPRRSRTWLAPLVAAAPATGLARLQPALMQVFYTTTILYLWATLAGHGAGPGGGSVRWLIVGLFLVLPWVFALSAVLLGSLKRRPDWWEPWFVWSAVILLLTSGVMVGTGVVGLWPLLTVIGLAAGVVVIGRGMRALLPNSLQTTSYCGDAGQQLPIIRSLLVLEGVAIRWHEDNAELQLRGLPDLDLARGSEARRILKTLLNYQHREVEPSRLVEARQLFRELPDLPTLLSRLRSVDADPEGWVSLERLPLVYTLALDLMLSGKMETPARVIELEVSARGAREIAELAEELDGDMAGGSNRGDR